MGSATCKGPASVVAEARKLLAAATPGEWSIHPHPRGEDTVRLQIGEFPGPHWSAWIPSLKQADARLLVASPRLLAALCDEADGLRAALEEVASDDDPNDGCAHAPTAKVALAKALREGQP